jgi:hypothetical protein
VQCPSSARTQGAGRNREGRLGAQDATSVAPCLSRHCSGSCVHLLMLPLPKHSPQIGNLRDSGSVHFPHAIARPIISIRRGRSPDAERGQGVCVIVNICCGGAIHRFLCDVAVGVVRKCGCLQAICYLSHCVWVRVRHSPIWVSRRGAKSGRAHVCEVYRCPTRASPPLWG